MVTEPVVPCHSWNWRIVLRPYCRSLVDVAVHEEDAAAGRGRHQYRQGREGCQPHGMTPTVAWPAATTCPSQGTFTGVPGPGWPFKVTVRLVSPPLPSSQATSSAVGCRGAQATRSGFS